MKCIQAFNSTDANFPSLFVRHEQEIKPSENSVIEALTNAMVDAMTFSSSGGICPGRIFKETIRENENQLEVDILGCYGVGEIHFFIKKTDSEGNISFSKRSENYNFEAITVNDNGNASTEALSEECPGSNKKCSIHVGNRQIWKAALSRNAFWGAFDFSSLYPYPLLLDEDVISVTALNFEKLDDIFKQDKSGIRLENAWNYLHWLCNKDGKLLVKDGQNLLDHSEPTQKVVNKEAKSYFIFPSTGDEHLFSLITQYFEDATKLGYTDVNLVLDPNTSHVQNSYNKLTGNNKRRPKDKIIKRIMDNIPSETVATYEPVVDILELELKTQKHALVFRNEAGKREFHQYNGNPAEKKKVKKEMEKKGYFFVMDWYGLPYGDNQFVIHQNSSKDKLNCVKWSENQLMFTVKMQ